MRLDPLALPIDGAGDGDGFHVVTKVEEGYHRLWFPEGDRVTNAAVLIPFDAHFFERLQSIQRFYRWLTDGAAGGLPRWQRFSPYQIHRFSLMLRAWDGVEAGVSRQQVASVLLNAEIGKLRSIDWKNTPERRRLHRLLKSAHELIEGGYLRLLQPETKSGGLFPRR